MKQRKCKNPDCGVKFTPARPLQTACGLQCSLIVGRKNAAKKARKALSDGRKSLKTRSDYIKELQIEFNKYIRLRDAKEGCISCEKLSSWNGQWHASHFYAVSVRPNLRFNENNVHKSCSICNNYKHGNLIPYRERLAVKISQEELEKLDRDMDIKKYTVDDLITMRKDYAKRCKEIEIKLKLQG